MCCRSRLTFEPKWQSNSVHKYGVLIRIVARSSTQELGNVHSYPMSISITAGGSRKVTGGVCAALRHMLHIEVPLGAVWEMWTGTPVYDGLMEAQICVGVCDGWLRPAFDDGCPAPLQELARRCWHTDAGCR